MFWLLERKTCFYQHKLSFGVKKNKKWDCQYLEREHSDQINISNRWELLSMHFWTLICEGAKYTDSIKPQVYKRIYKSTLFTQFHYIVYAISIEC